LDIGLTLEYLETRGVPVYGYGTDEMPAFFTRKSGFKLVQRVDSSEQAAACFDAQMRLGYAGGAVVANPIPEEYSMDETFITDNINKALADANAKGVKGKDVTPFLLSAIDKATEGKSLDSNIQLVFNNARVASEIAVSLAGKKA
jgi:pseudouridine-5'-phosphate glycosidase